MRRLLPHKRAVVLAGAVTLGLPALAALRGSGPDEANIVTVKREDLLLGVDVEGELAAERSVEIGPPAVVEVEFKIAFLAPEGAEVKKGTALVGFDTEALERQLADKTAELAEASKKTEQKEIDLRMKLLELEQQIAQTEAELGRATLKAEAPPEVQQRVELEKAKLDQQGRERELRNLQAERQATAARGDAELKSLRSQRDRARGRVEALQEGIARMTVLAPQDGIVVYRTNWRDEKKKVGDSMWFGETVLSLPDLAQMRGDGFVDEADGGAVAEGQDVTLRLESRPDLDLRGHVKRVGRTVRQRSWRTPGKFYKVEIVLERADPRLLRPAMRFRGEIETGRLPGRVLVPRAVVFLRDSGPAVWVKGVFGWKEVRVGLGRSNRQQVEVVSGLAEGDRVSAIDLAAPGPGTSHAPGGA
jgi:HlyD family secretion protein